MQPMHRARRYATLAALIVCAAAAVPFAVRALPGPAAPSAFAARIQELSEPGGDFDTDNLISNEKSYLHVVPALRAAGLGGGAYIGVGPDQNFSYIAQIKPSIAFIVDIRRDNLLMHLLFKALFARAATRAEYLSLLMGRAAPEPAEKWRDAPIDVLVSYIDRTQPEASAVQALRRRLDETIKGFGVPLSPADFATIDRFHRTFIDAGLSLKFQSRGRPARSYYPTYRDLLLETDRSDHQWNYLVSERDYQVVRALEVQDLVIPVVGDLSGPRALRAIAAFMTEHHQQLSAFYTSNVENYLFQDGRFAQFEENVTRLPRTPRSLIIRSIFGVGLRATVPGYYSTSVVQPVDELVAGYATGRYRSYWDLIRDRN